jgi:chemotaxis signal transduction protein
MHVVLWTSADRRYAIETVYVQEVISLVEAQSVPDSPAWLKGLINYRGQLVPLVDAPRLLGHGPSEPRMASRILMIETGRSENTAEGLLGLLVQSVLGSENLDFTAQPEYPGLARPAMDFLGPMALTDVGAVQLIDPRGIVGL